METTSIAGLPATPLPGVDMAAAVSVTIWLVCLLAICGIFYRLLRGRNGTWPEFNTIMIGTIILAV